MTNLFNNPNFSIKNPEDLPKEYFVGWIYDSSTIRPNKPILRTEEAISQNLRLPNGIYTFTINASYYENKGNLVIIINNNNGKEEDYNVPKKNSIDVSIDIEIKNLNSPISFVNGDDEDGYITLNYVSVVLKTKPGSGICYCGNSMVFSKNTKTGEIGNVEAKNIVAGVHEVFSINKNKFVTVTENVITGPTDNIYLIKRNALGIDMPNKDLYITSGHIVVVNGKSTKVRDIPQARRTNKKEKVYSICLDKNEPILINNLAVNAWGLEKMKKFTSDNNIHYECNI